MKPWYLLLCCGVLFSGCNTVEKRIKENQAYYNELTPAQREHILKYVPILGDKKKDVLIALGSPVRSIVDGKREELWFDGVPILGNDATFTAADSSQRVRSMEPVYIYKDLTLVFVDDVLVSTRQSVSTYRPNAHDRTEPAAVPGERPYKWEPKSQGQLAAEEAARQR